VSNFLSGLPLVDRGIELLQSNPARRRQALKRKLRDELRASGLTVGPIDVEHGSDQQPPWLTGIRVREHRIALIIARGVERSRVYWYLFDRLPSVLYLARLTGKNVDFVADVSDGHMGYTNVLGFSTNQDSVCLIPDPDFFNSRGYADVRDREAPGWSERKAEIIWRGSPNGQGLIANSTMSADDESLIQRVRMCLLLRGQVGIDARLVVSDRTEDLRSEDARLLQQAGLVGQAIDRSEWWQRRFAIDTDGYTNAWSGLFVRLLMGCCVLKVASPTSHRQWYYHRLQPWQHYIPVAADLSDLQHRIEWCQAHGSECEQVAKRGRELALSMDFNTEYQQAAVALVNSPEVTVRM
ncbi:MAG TPA: glycosyl transferase family 90, partial [Xanthomonadales bacterium]|nr:glycosyl transferase family 90 [Xanthomonadales bacterium]